MTFTLRKDVLAAMRTASTVLRITSDGFYDGSKFRTELIATVTDTSIVRKLFKNDVFVHSSDQCGSDPNCTRCRHFQARQYLRLRVEVDGRAFQLDLPPTAALRFVELARYGIEGTLRLTCTHRQRRDQVCGEVGFEIVRRAA